MFAAPNTAPNPTGPTATTARPLVAWVQNILIQAIQADASDIHFEPHENELHIRYRTASGFKNLQPVGLELAEAATNHLKALAGLNTTQTATAQDGRLSITNLQTGKAVQLRINTLPTQFGESVALRVLNSQRAGLALSQLGMPANMQAQLLQTLQRGRGLVLVVGATGAGKSTTLHAALQQAENPARKVLTLEDPIEYRSANWVQVEINETASPASMASTNHIARPLTFSTALRAALRHDPDTLLIGELRGPETAHVALQAALTGHLVLSTLHAPCPLTAITRLLDMGLPPALVASGLEAVVAQTLVPCTQNPGTLTGNFTYQTITPQLRTAIAAGAPRSELMHITQSSA